MENMLITDNVNTEINVNDDMDDSALPFNYEKYQIQETFKGVIVQYFPKRNYGFLRQSDNDVKINKKDFFFHKSQVLDQTHDPLVTPGDICEFRIGQEKSREMAISVKILERNKIRTQQTSNFKKTKRQQYSNNNKAKLFKDSILLLFNEATKSKNKY